MQKESTDTINDSKNYKWLRLNVINRLLKPVIVSV